MDKCTFRILGSAVLDCPDRVVPAPFVLKGFCLPVKNAAGLLIDRGTGDPAAWSRCLFQCSNDYCAPSRPRRWCLVAPRSRRARRHVGNHRGRSGHRLPDEWTGAAGCPGFWKKVITGLVIILAVVFDQLQERLQQRLALKLKRS
jgi:hypothetical protein